jgi:hypothetical protein
VADTLVPLPADRPGSRRIPRSCENLLWSTFECDVRRSSTSTKGATHMAGAPAPARKRSSVDEGFAVRKSS